MDPGTLILGGAALWALLSKKTDPNATLPGAGAPDALVKINTIQDVRQSVLTTGAAVKAMIPAAMPTAENGLAQGARKAVDAAVGVAGGAIAAGLVGAAVAGHLAATLASIASSVAAAWPAILVVAFLAIALTIAHFAARADRWYNWYHNGTPYDPMLYQSVRDFAQAVFTKVQQCNPEQGLQQGLVITTRKAYDGDVPPGVPNGGAGNLGSYFWAACVMNIPIGFVQDIGRLAVFSAVREIWKYNQTLTNFYLFRGWTSAQIVSQGIARLDTPGDFWTWVQGELANIANPYLGLVGIYTLIPTDDGSTSTVVNTLPPTTGHAWASTPIPGLNNFGQLETFAAQFAGANLKAFMDRSHMVGDVRAMTRAAIDGYSFAWPGDENYTKAIAACAGWTAVLLNGAWFAQDPNTGVLFDVIKSRENEVPTFKAPADTGPACPPQINSGI